MPNSLRSMILLPLCAALFTLAPAAAPAMADDPDRCGTYPDAVHETTYGAWSDCLLRDLGEKPLWRGSRHPDQRQRIRFTFTPGHGGAAKIIDFVERPDRTGTLTFISARNRDGDTEIVARRRYRVSAADVARLDALGEASGTWGFVTGSWDDDEMYMHCQVLDMERINAAGYRYSSVNIGCNHPARLMPLVDFLTGLAGLQPSEGGRFY